MLQSTSMYIILLTVVMLSWERYIRQLAIMMGDIYVTTGAVPGDIK